MQRQAYVWEINKLNKRMKMQKNLWLADVLSNITVYVDIFRHY